MSFPPGGNFHPRHCLRSLPVVGVHPRPKLPDGLFVGVHGRVCQVAVVNPLYHLLHVPLLHVGKPGVTDVLGHDFQVRQVPLLGGRAHAVQCLIPAVLPQQVGVVRVNFVRFLHHLENALHFLLVVGGQYSHILSCK